jgi:hypothetical protein
MSELAIYLNDHLAGSTVGVELAKRSAKANEGTEYGPELARIAAEIDEDRDALKTMLDELDITEDKLKTSAGWLAEKFGRLKLNGSLLSYNPLSRLIELEGLFLGVNGKRAMWLNVQASVGARVKSVDLTDLIARAESQSERLEAMRTTAAAEALPPSAESGARA